MPPRSSELPAPADRAPAAGPEAEAVPPGQGPSAPDPGGTVTPMPADIPRVPWSELAPEFISAWGYPDGRFDPEHVEILGPSGSGKTVFEETILTERAAARDSAIVFVATKSSDKQIQALHGCGWPIVTDWGGVEQHKQCVFWPQTRALGRGRREYLAGKIDDLLSRLWHKESHTVVAFDEIKTIEGLSPETAELIAMWWREARSVGNTIVAMKQRPQGIQRDMHSETSWVVSFRPKDEDDGKRYAELFGSRSYYLPVLMNLDRSNYEFLIQDVKNNTAVISWIDVPLEPLPKKHYQARRY